MLWIVALAGLALAVAVLVDVFETIILPRTVMRRLRLSNLFFDLVGSLYIRVGAMKPGPRRQGLLVAFAPLSLLVLILLWGVLIILAWALILLGLDVAVGSTPLSISDSLYFSGVTFLTLGYGDLTPVDGLGKFLAVVEAGSGFGYIALVIGYVPVLYSSFSRRETQILLLDSRAGSEPIGLELLVRHARANCMSELPGLLKEWERFAAQLLESYLSYPLLAYYRSQHDNQSWLKSLTALMDACAVVELGFQGDQAWADELGFQARATFAMGRHVIVDLCYILDIPPVSGDLTRLEPKELLTIKNVLREAGLHLSDGPEAVARFIEVRRMYEPYVLGLAHKLVLDLPLWMDESIHVDNWQTSAWEGARHF